MRVIILLLGVLFFSFGGAKQLLAEPAVLTAEAWQADLDHLVRTVDETHPQPFRYVPEDAWRADVSAFRAEIPNLDDHRIILRMAALVARLRDGHARLSVPRGDDLHTFNVAHSEDPPPSDARLNFDRLPVALEPFEEGLAVVGISSALKGQKLLGARVEKIAGQPAADILKAAHAFAYGENDLFRDLVAADLLVLPEVLAVLGIIPDAKASVTMMLVGEDGDAQRVSLKGAPAEASGWTRLSSGALWSENPRSSYWKRAIDDQNIVYVQIDKIGDDGEQRLAPFMADAVAEAERKNARLVIDLRWNTGGSADYNRAITLAIAQSPQINQFARCFILTGPRTFSAAQMLVNDLERYTRATFIGAPTGARPDSFGDPQKLQLPNSGLTLRVSELHWSSWLARDNRAAAAPLIDTPITLAAMREGKDPALDAVAAFDPSWTMVDLFGMALERGDQYGAYRYLFGHVTAPDTSRDDASGDLLKLGKRYEAEGKSNLASLAYRYGAAFYPDSEALKREVAALRN